MSTWSSSLARRCLAAAGWKVLNQPLPGPKAVVVFYPHTSNWDFVFGILARAVIQLPASFAAKDSLFAWPHGALFRSLGGVAVNRRERSGFVGQMAQQFKERPSFYLAIAPEGTRRLTPGWKSGFYRLAQEAQVPLALAFIDYAQREVGILGYVQICGDAERDFANIRAAYAGRQGRHPQQQGPIALWAAQPRDDA